MATIQSKRVEGCWLTIVMPVNVSMERGFVRNGAVRESVVMIPAGINRVLLLLNTFHSQLTLTLIVNLNFLLSSMNNTSPPIQIRWAGPDSSGILFTNQWRAVHVQ